MSSACQTSVEPNIPVALKRLSDAFKELGDAWVSNRNLVGGSQHQFDEHGLSVSVRETLLPQGLDQSEHHYGQCSNAVVSSGHSPELQSETGNVNPAEMNREDDE